MVTYGDMHAEIWLKLQVMLLRQTLMQLPEYTSISRFSWVVSFQMTFFFHHSESFFYLSQFLFIPQTYRGERPCWFQARAALTFWIATSQYELSDWRLLRMVLGRRSGRLSCHEDLVTALDLGVGGRNMPRFASPGLNQLSECMFRHWAGLHPWVEWFPYNYI